ncbi:MAG: hypothetical protein ACR2KX_16230 [Chitinophagaceae bacterium]
MEQALLVYDIVTNTWSSAQLKEVRSVMAEAAAGNQVFIGGGQ